MKASKNDRIGVIINTLTENPKKLYTLNYFTELLNSAKSTLSEDIDYIRKIFATYELGQIETITGASGGIQYKPTLNENQISKFCTDLCKEINNKDRIIAGDYIYMNDIFYNPQKISTIGKIFANPYHDSHIDYVVTIETTGIPIAIMTAKMLNKPVVVVRKSARLTEGTTIQMNYISGSSKRIQTMALAKRAIPKGAKVLLIDDFMKAGATAKGIVDLVAEFEAEVVGVSVVMSTAEPTKKLINNYNSLLVLENVDAEKQEIIIRPNN